MDRNIHLANGTFHIAEIYRWNVKLMNGISYYGNIKMEFPTFTWDNLHFGNIHMKFHSLRGVSKIIAKQVSIVKQRPVL